MFRGVAVQEYHGHAGEKLYHFIIIIVFFYIKNANKF